jgi:hypothetical protein
LIVFRIVVLIVQRGAPTARVLVLLFWKVTATAKFSTLIGFVPLLGGIVDAGASLAALTLILRHECPWLGNGDQTRMSLDVPMPPDREL